MTTPSLRATRRLMSAFEMGTPAVALTPALNGASRASVDIHSLCASSSARPSKS